MSRDSNNQSPKYTITSAVIHADRYTASLNESSVSSERVIDFDVTKDLVELNIFESLDRAYLTGNCTIVDKDSIFSSMRLQGTERITINMSTADINQTPVLIEKTFIMYQTKNQVKMSNGSASVFLFNLIDEHGFLGRITKISRSYSGSIEKTVKSILQNDLNRELEISYTGVTDGSSQNSIQEDIKCIIPNMTAIDAVEWLTSRLTTINGTPYFIYATMRLPNLHSGVDNLEVSDDDEAVLQGNIIRIGNLDTMLRQKEFNKIPFVYNPNRTDSIHEGNPVQQLFTIKSVKTGSSGNTLRLAELGAFSAEYSNTDLNTGEIFTTRCTIEDTIEKLRNDDIISEERGFSQEVYDGVFNLNGKRLLDYDSVKYHGVTSSGTYGNFKSYHDEEDNSKFKTKISSTGMKNVLHKSTITVVTEGAAILVAGAKVGDIMKVLISADNDTSESSLYDKRLSGRYLMYDIKHSFAGEMHDATITLCKLDSEI